MHFLGRLKNEKFRQLDGKELQIDSELTDGIWWIFGKIDRGIIKPDLASKLSGLNLELYKKSKNKLKKVKKRLNV